MTLRLPGNLAAPPGEAYRWPYRRRCARSSGAASNEARVVHKADITRSAALHEPTPRAAITSPWTLLVGYFGRRELSSKETYLTAYHVRQGFPDPQAVIRQLNVRKDQYCIDDGSPLSTAPICNDLVAFWCAPHLVHTGGFRYRERSGINCRCS